MVCVCVCVSRFICCGRDSQGSQEMGSEMKQSRTSRSKVEVLQYCTKCGAWASQKAAAAESAGAGWQGFME